MDNNLNFGRKLLLQKFDNFCSKQNFPKNLTIAIVGGNRDEPELEIIKKYTNIEKISVFGIDTQSDEYFDLNTENKNNEYMSFDLIICAQVIEHIWNVNEFFLNLKSLCNDNTILYINCPKSNMEHGSPEYFSSGYSVKFLEKNLQKINFKILESGEVGSEVYYKSIHLLQDWFTEEEVLNRYKFKSKSLRFKLKHFSKLFNIGNYLVLKRNNDRKTSNFMTDVFVFGTLVN
ncbi:class I SAM-dependent methyltransferase [Acidimicrobiaceae bacterium]|nr:class I SAM-dependent methyltransferase [Acidimicrobiaceae bacterium]